MVDVTYHKDTKEPMTVHRFDTQYWEVKIPEEASKELKKKLEKLVDKREDWPRALYEFVIKKMTFVIDKETDLDLKKLQFEETVIAVSNSWKELVKLREVSKQKDLKEAIQENSGKITPGKKK